MAQRKVGFKITVLVGAIMFLLGAAVAVYGSAEATEFTGCLDKKGSLYNVTVSGRAPWKDGCDKDDLQIKWNQVGPAGPQGPQGEKGDKGEPGTPGAALQGVWRSQEFTSLRNSPTVHGVAQCQPDEMPLSGGHVSGDTYQVRMSAPVMQGAKSNGWGVLADFGEAGTHTLTVHVLCGPAM